MGHSCPFGLRKMLTAALLWFRRVGMACQKYIFHVCLGGLAF